MGYRDSYYVPPGSAATKLLEFPKFKHPLEIFIGYVVEEVVFTRNSQLDLIVEAVQNLTGNSFLPPHKKNMCLFERGS